jgi:hypothetical protein
MKTGLGEPDLRHRIRNIDASLRLVIDKNLNYAPRSLLHIGRLLKHNISLPLRGFACKRANVVAGAGNSMAREQRPRPKRQRQPITRSRQTITRAAYRSGNVSPSRNSRH